MHRLVLLIPCALVLAANTARAQQPTPGSDADQRARVHFAAATQYYDDGRFEEAIPEFREAWRLSQRPEMLLNLATAAEHALSFGDAASALTEYLTHVPNAPDAEAIQRRITRNQDAAARMAHGQTVAPDTTNTLTTAAVTGPTTPPPPPPTAAPTHGGGLGGLAVGGIVTMGVGAAAMITALVLGLVADGTYSTLATECPTHVCTVDHSADASSGKSLAVTSTVLLFAGAGVAAVGLVLFLLGLGEHHADVAPTAGALQLVPGPGDVGLAARVRL